VVGLYLSYEVDISSGAAIVITAALLFVGVFSFSSLKGRFFGRKPELDRLEGESAVALASGVLVTSNDNHNHDHSHVHAEEHHF